MKSKPTTGKPEWRNTLNLVVNLTRREVASQYKRTALGRVWSLITPLATIAVFSVIFGLVFRGSVEPGLNSGLNSFALWIGIGVICWGFISSGCSAGMHAFTSNAGLLTKVYFPRFSLVISLVASMAFNFATELLVLTIIMAIFGGPTVLLYIPVLLLLLVLTAIFVGGLALLLSVANVYFRDMQHLWNIVNQVWMYASGVVFPISMLASVQERAFAAGYSWGGEPLPLLTLFRLNPAEQFLEAYRSVLYDFAMPPGDVWLSIIAWSVVSLAAGVLVYRRHAARIVEEL